MLKRSIKQLAVYTTEKEEETISFAELHGLYLQKTSEIIYIVKEKKLYGIVCLREALYHNTSGRVKINKTFTSLNGFNVYKAHEIFKNRPQIHKIPVINTQGELIGDYSRWDDMLYIERTHAQFMKKEMAERVLLSYDKVYLVEPVDKNDVFYIQLEQYLDSFDIKYIKLGKEKLGEIIYENILYENAICIFLNEDERRGIECLYGIRPRIYDSQEYNVLKYDLLEDDRCKARLATYKSLLFQIIEETQLENLNINKPLKYFPCDRIDDKATVLLSKLEDAGVKCFCIYSLERERTEYGKAFRKEIYDKQKIHLLDAKQPWPKREDNEEFYGELYQRDDYKNETAQKEIFEGNASFTYKKNVKGKYFNAVNGKRITCFQPEKYIGTIFLLGPCSIIGLYAEDQYTIASYLQKNLLEKGYEYRVVNYGHLVRPDSAIDVRLGEIGTFSKNDILIYQSTKGEAIDIDGFSLEGIYEKNQVPFQWITNVYGHCNYKTYNMIADSMFEMIQPYLKQKELRDDYKKIQICIHDIMKKYIDCKYLKQYFTKFKGKQYKSVGAIVMNCNPFSLGHRYLIECAKKQVEFLILFVVEEEASLFPFEERYLLVKDGVKDLENVMVVPSGEFILSKNTLKEYFSKEDDEAVVINAEYDIQIFVDYIAQPLNITYRFAGEEPEDAVTRAYNNAMRKILPQNGIKFIEISRKQIEDIFISASRVRKYLEIEEYDHAFGLLPDTTVEYIKHQMSGKE